MKIIKYPNIHEAIASTALIFLIIGLCVGGFSCRANLDWEDYISSLATLIATFLGAWFAFHLTNRARIREENENKFMHLSKSLFVLMRQINVIEGFGKDIDRYQEDEKLAFEMPAYKTNEYNDLKLDFDGLAFLASTDYVQDLLHLTIEQERFEQVLECLRIRHAHYNEKVMPEMIASDLTDRKASLDEYISKLRDETYKGALQGARQVRLEINAYRESSLVMHKRLHSIAKALFPEQSFIEIIL
mgnify:CR=1 FL=1